MFLSGRRVSSSACVTTSSRLPSWGRWEGGFGAEEDKRPGEDLHHDTRGHLQFWLHRSVSLLLRDGRFGKTHRRKASTAAPQVVKSHQVHRVLTKRCLLSRPQRSPRVMYFSSDQGDTFSRALLPSASTEQVRNTCKQKRSAGAGLLLYSKLDLIFSVLVIVTKTIIRISELVLLLSSYIVLELPPFPSWLAYFTYIFSRTSVIVNMVFILFIHSSLIRKFLSLLHYFYSYTASKKHLLFKNLGFFVPFASSTFISTNSKRYLAF